MTPLAAPALNAALQAPAADAAAQTPDTIDWWKQHAQDTLSLCHDYKNLVDKMKKKSKRDQQKIRSLQTRLLPEHDSKLPKNFPFCSQINRANCNKEVNDSAYKTAKKPMAYVSDPLVGGQTLDSVRSRARAQANTRLARKN